MLNFKRKGIEEFNDLSSIDQYYRSIEEGYSPDDALNFINLRSRDNSRTPFPWNREQYGGFSPVKPWLGMTEEYPSINAESQIGKMDSIFEFYKNLIQFRQNGPYRDCFIYGKIEPVHSSKNVIAYKRYTEDDVIYCWFNFSDCTTDEGFPTENMKVIWENYKASDISGIHLKLHPWQSVLLKKNK